MKLQVALDLTSKRKALEICRKVARYVDIIELGTPLIKQEGLKIVKDFKQFKKPIVVDLKTMDTGFLEAELAFNCLLYTSPSPRDLSTSRMPSSA